MSRVQNCVLCFSTTQVKFCWRFCRIFLRYFLLDFAVFFRSNICDLQFLNCFNNLHQNLHNYSSKIVIHLQVCLWMLFSLENCFVKDLPRSSQRPFALRCITKTIIRSCNHAIILLFPAVFFPLLFKEFSALGKSWWNAFAVICFARLFNTSDAIVNNLKFFIGVGLYFRN